MKTFEQNIITMYGEKGKQWLNNLPQLIVQMKATYGLSNLKALNNLSHNYVLSGLQCSKQIILKCGLDIDGLKREAAALIAFSGFGSVQVFSQTPGLLILECAAPGVTLKSYFPKFDDEAINITANVIKRLHKAPIPSAHAFPHLKDWLATLDNDQKIPAEYLQKARQLRDDLLKTSTKEVLLHGDLHHDNILQNGDYLAHQNFSNETDMWVVIDPKGVIGESAYEVAAFICNPMPELLNGNDAPNIIHNRITRFSELLECKPQRILQWCFVQSVLAMVWAHEDGLDTGYFEKLSRIFDVIYLCK